MKKILGALVSTCLLLTGCSSTKLSPLPTEPLKETPKEVAIIKNDLVKVDALPYFIKAFESRNIHAINCKDIPSCKAEWKMTYTMNRAFWLRPPVGMFITYAHLGLLKGSEEVSTSEYTLGKFVTASEQTYPVRDTKAVQELIDVLVGRLLGEKIDLPGVDG